MWKTLLPLCLLISQVAAAGSLDPSFQFIRDRTPSSRHWGGGFSLLFGGMALTRGILLINDSDSRNDEKFIGGALVALGTLRAVDGSSRIFNRSRAEELADRYFSEEQKTSYWVDQMRQEAEIARRKRILRGAAIGLLGVGYLYLYQRDTTRHASMIYSGISLVGVCLFRLLGAYPIETAYNGLPEDLKVTFTGTHLRVSWNF